MLIGLIVNTDYFHRFVMGDFVNGMATKIATGIISIVILGINMYFLAIAIFGKLDQWYYIAPLVVFFIIYFAFIAYLSIYLLICLGWESLASVPWIRRIYRVELFVNDAISANTSTTTVQKC